MKFKFFRSRYSGTQPRILDIGCGNNSPSHTKRWFPGCHYVGADIQDYNMNDGDRAALDGFFRLGTDASGYDLIPDNSFDFVIVNHVLEHMVDPAPVLALLCGKLRPGGYIWIAFPSLRSLSLPSAEGCLQFCDDFSHVYLPDVREVTNVLLKNHVKVLHAGRSKYLVRSLIGVAVLPWEALRLLFTGKFSGSRLWYLVGFEDHVFGQASLP